MQAVDGPDSSQLEWHQIGVKTNGPNSSQLQWHQDGVKTMFQITRSKFGSGIREKTTFGRYLGSKPENFIRAMRLPDERVCG
jgi:hypothetical protein